MNLEQRTNLKFLVWLGKTPSECLELLQQVYGNNAMSCTLVFEWHKRFNEGREEVEDEQRSRRPSTSRTADNTEQVKQLVRADHCLLVWTIASELSISKETVWRIITEDLGICAKICAKMVPKLLSDNQKERRVLVCKDILERLETESNLLGKGITGDESWIFENDPETK